MSTRVGELCVDECFCCSFGDTGFECSCMRSVCGRGLGTLGMRTRRSELCFVECCFVVLLMLGVNDFVREEMMEEGWERLG